MTNALTTIIQSAAVLVPIGVSPLLALPVFSGAALLGLYNPPPGLVPFTHPAVGALALLLGVFVKFGRGTRLPRPIFETVESLASLLAPAIAVAVMIPCFLRANLVEPSDFGVPTISVAILIVALATLAIVTFRTALEVLIWLSPIPFANLGFQLFKLMIILTLSVLAMCAPLIAVVVDAGIVLAALFTVRWAARVVRFGGEVLYDLTLRRLRPRQALPRDPNAPARLGPFDIFVLDVDGAPRHSHARLSFEEGRWWVERGAGTEVLRERLGEAEKAAFFPGWLGTTLVLPKGRVLLPPRYQHLIPRLQAATGVNAPRPRPRSKSIRRTVARA